MLNINNIINYYIENDHLNLNNNISIDDLKILINCIHQFNIIINIVNIPINFKYYNIVYDNFSNIKINVL